MVVTQITDTLIHSTSVLGSGPSDVYLDCSCWVDTSGGLLGRLLGKHSYTLGDTVVPLTDSVALSLTSMLSLKYLHNL